MTLTFLGRIQTRLFLTAIVGPLWIVPWTLFTHDSHTPTLVALGYSLTMIVLFALLGIAWECVYHCLQQLRRDRDWPSLFYLLGIINEGSALWLTTSLVGALRPLAASLPYFVATMSGAWISMWLVSQGPLRVIFIRYRLSGGRIVGGSGARPMQSEISARVGSGSELLTRSTVLRYRKAIAGGILALSSVAVLAVTMSAGSGVGPNPSEYGGSIGGPSETSPSVDGGRTVPEAAEELPAKSRPVESAQSSPSMQKLAVRAGTRPALTLAPLDDEQQRTTSTTPAAVTGPGQIADIILERAPTEAVTGPLSEVEPGGGVNGAVAGVVGGALKLDR